MRYDLNLNLSGTGARKSGGYDKIARQYPALRLRPETNNIVRRKKPSPFNTTLDNGQASLGFNLSQTLSQND